MARRVLTECLTELSGSFRRVQSAELPDNQTPTSLAPSSDGLQRLHGALLLTRPLTDYQPPSRRRRPAGSISQELMAEDTPGPSTP
jgi:hypothetical protein